MRDGSEKVGAVEFFLEGIGLGMPALVGWSGCQDGGMAGCQRVGMSSCHHGRMQARFAWSCPPCVRHHVPRRWQGPGCPPGSRVAHGSAVSPAGRLSRCRGARQRSPSSACPAPMISGSGLPPAGWECLTLRRARAPRWLARTGWWTRRRFPQRRDVSASGWF